MEACLAADEVPTPRPVATPQQEPKASPGADASSENEKTGDGEVAVPVDPYFQNENWCSETMVDSPHSIHIDSSPSGFLLQDRCPDWDSSYFAGHVAESQEGTNGQPSVPDRVSTSTVGTQEKQPLLKPVPVEVPEAEPFEGLIPNITDPKAPRPALGEPQISQEAIRQRAKRIFLPRRDGSLKVSQEIFKEWKGRGKDRKNLEEIFKRCGYNAEAGIENKYTKYILSIHRT